MSNKYAFLPKREINMAGYGLSFFQVFMDCDKADINKKAKE